MSSAKRNVCHNGIFSSPDEGQWVPETPKGSFYKELMLYVKKHLIQHGDWKWLNNCITGDVTMASEIEGLTKKFAVVFQSLGFGPGDGIHIVVGNYNLSYAALFATWYLGGFGSCGDVTLDSKAITAQLNDTKAKLILCLPETFDRVNKALKESRMNGTAQLFCFGDMNNGCPNIFDLLSKAEPEDAPEEPVDAQDIKNDTVVVFWSSGTTGLPKGICHSHYGAWNFKSSIGQDIPAFTNNVTTSVFFHIGGFFTGILALTHRQTYYHMFGSGFNLTVLLNAIKEAGPKSISLGTHHYVQLSESQELQETDPCDLLSVEKILPLGAAVPDICEVKLKQKFANLKRVFNIYGQTEAGLIMFGDTQTHLGTVASACSVKIVDPDTGDICGPNQIGELRLKGPAMMTKYLCRPEETRDYFDPQGYGCTGDLGFCDQDNKIYFIDRMKELIKYKNNHVSPTEIEAVLQTHPKVNESLVFGRKDPTVQELVSAVVVPNESVTEEELITFVNDRVIEYKKIRGGIVFRNAIPRNSVGKLLRRKMREWAEQQV